MPSSRSARIRGSTPLRAWCARAVVLLSALLQLVVTPAAAVAEGRYAQQAGLAYAHVEAERSTACIATHPRDCALCQFLSAAAAPTAPPTALPTPATARGVCRAEDVLVRARAGRGAPSTRAPPIVG